MLSRLLICLMIVCIGCTSNQFTIDDERIDKIPIPGNKKNQVSFSPQIKQSGFGGTGGVSPFPEGNIVQIFTWDVGVQLSQYRYYKSMSPGTLSPLELPMVLVNGLYDFYAVSVNSSQKPPEFSYSIADRIFNGTDYLWYLVRDQVIENPTTLSISFKHCATQVVIQAVNAGDEKIVDWINASTMAAPVIDSTVTWNLYNGQISPAKSFSMIAPLNMTAFGLTCQQLIVPVTGASEFFVYLQMKLYNEDEVRGYPLTIPIPAGGLAAGHSYQYKVLFSQDTVQVSNVNIASWIEVDEYGNPLYPGDLEPL